MTGLETVNTLYSLTEFYEFASRLAEQGIFPEGLSISIDLRNVENRRLFSGDFTRQLYREYVCTARNLPHPTLELTEVEILGKAHDFAINHTLWIFERFNWSGSDLSQFLRQEQDKFLRGTFRS
jgi:hypothetical protein